MELIDWLPLKTRVKVTFIRKSLLCQRYVRISSWWAHINQ
jgi:hypothetical protein